ncbi:MAG: glycoside hydrolase family 2 protein [Aggregatilineales bacterium]
MHIKTLNGSWTLAKTGDSENYPATVPGCVHTDLITANVIPDPFYRDNESQQEWVGETDWTYSRTFHVSPDFLAHDAVLLRCHGLDTIATISINGQQIAETQNMFRTYEFDVKPHVHKDENIITIDFRSPMQYVRHMDETLGKMAGWVEPMRVNSGAWIRKEPCNFGWDWGPKLPTAGIWRDIELVAFNTARLDDLLILQEHSPESVHLDVRLAAQTLADTPLTANIRVYHDGVLITEKTGIPLSENRAETLLVIDDPKLWWVSGLGEQPLYEVRVELHGNDNLLDTLTKTIGLRVLQLETPADEWGQAMYFTCNGVKFFAKGANWIPASPYAAEVTREKLQVFVKASAEANMNMLRVWGGGIYEEDDFYDLCDQYGIAVWQDFMFACGTYPASNESWLDNVRHEAIQNVKRIRHHASLALWCGNNEIEQGMIEPEWEETVGWDEYDLLFVDTLGELVHEYDPQRRYWQGSPHSPGNVRDPFDQTVGDTHLWSVWHGKEPFEWYRTRQDRFCSEFGFQSFPEPATVDEFTEPMDRNITSYVMEQHQRSQIGNATIIHYMLDWYQLPNGFDNVIWLSQILHGMAMKYAVEHWRRNMPRTMGTLYWQLNDMWGGPSWASIDWRGRWKAVHYMAKRFYNRLLISGVEDIRSNSVDIYVTSDELRDIVGKVVYTITNTQGQEITRNELTTSIKANTSTQIKRVDVTEVVEKYDSRDLLIWLELYIGDTRVSENLVLLSRPKHIEFADPQISVRIDPIEENVFDITLKTQAPALYTWLTLPDATFSDNFIDLRPKHERTIRMTVPLGMTRLQVQALLKVQSLYDTYK